jgi:hypothetical protein
MYYRDIESDKKASQERDRQLKEQAAARRAKRK